MTNAYVSNLLKYSRTHIIYTFWYMQRRVYVGLTAGCPSICLSSVDCAQQHAAGLLLDAPRARDIDRQPPQHGAQQHGGRQQMRAVSHLQPP